MLNDCWKKITKILPLTPLVMVACTVKNDMPSEASITPESSVIEFVGATSEQPFLRGNSTTMINWQVATGQSNAARLESSTDGGVTWTTMVNYIVNIGYFAFTAPAVDTPNFQLRVVDDNGLILAKSHDVEIITAAPTLDPAKFVSTTAISTNEFLSYVASGEKVTASNPSLNGHIWKFDFAPHTIQTKAKLVVRAPVSHSQFGGTVFCVETTCTYSAPVTAALSDKFQVILEDMIVPTPNQSSIIEVTVDPNLDPSTFVPSTPGSGTVYIVTTSDYLTKIPLLQPGDTLKLSPGNYPPIKLSGINGTPAANIVIESLNPADKAVITATPAKNNMDLLNSSNLELRNLKFDGGNNAASSGLKTDLGNSNRTYNITVNGCEFMNFSGAQSQVALSTKNPTWGWVIKNNIIHDAGTGIYLGNSDGTMPFVGGIIENNLIHQTWGYNMQIKHHPSRTMVTGMPTAPQKAIIRNNVFMKGALPSPDGNRPNVLCGGYPEIGYGSSDYCEVYGNFFFDNPNESNLQISGRAIVHHNIFVKAAFAAINIQDHSGLTSRVNLIYQNTILDAAFGIYINDVGTETRLVGNVIFANTPIFGSGAILDSNRTGAIGDASSYVLNSSSVLGSLDAVPKTGALVVAPFSLTYFTSNPHNVTSAIDKDFNDNTNLNTFQGAYSIQGTNTGWVLARAPKGSVIPAPAPVTIPTIPSIASFDDPTITSSLKTYCPDMTVPPAAGIYRVCNSGDSRAGCTGATVIKPLNGQTLAAWTTALQTFMANVPDNSKVEWVYNDSNPVNYSVGPNDFNVCDVAIPNDNIINQGVCGGPGKRPILRYSMFGCPNPSSSKGIFVNKGDHNKFLNLEFRDMFGSVADNIAGIRDEGINSVIGYSHFVDGNNGILTSNFHPATNSLLIAHSLFEGLGAGGGGYSHSIYLSSKVDHAYIKNSLFLRSKNLGHILKSRAQAITINCSVLSARTKDPAISENNWNENAVINLPQGGKTLITNSILVKGSSAATRENIVAYGDESAVGSPGNYFQSFEFTNNVVYNRKTGAFFLRYANHPASSKSEATTFKIQNNTFFNLGLTYNPTAFFLKKLGDPIEFDLSQAPHNNTLNGFPPAPSYTGLGAQNVLSPGYPDSALNCPDFEWVY